MTANVSSLRNVPREFSTGADPPPSAHQRMRSAHGVEGYGHEKYSSGSGGCIDESNNDMHM